MNKLLTGGDEGEHEEDDHYHEDFRGGKKFNKKNKRAQRKRRRTKRLRGGDEGEHEEDDHYHEEFRGGKKIKKKNKRTKRRTQRKRRKGGKKTGIIETAAVPFGLFAVQHIMARRKSAKKIMKGGSSININNLTEYSTIKTKIQTAIDEKKVILDYQKTIKDYAKTNVHLFVNEIVNKLNNANSESTFTSGILRTECWIQYDSTKNTKHKQQIKMTFPLEIIKTPNMTINKSDVTISTQVF